MRNTQEDIHAQLQSGQDFGQERLAYVADTWKGRLDPSEHLRAGRHGEWTQVCPLTELLVTFAASQAIFRASRPGLHKMPPLPCRRFTTALQG